MSYRFRDLPGLCKPTEILATVDVNDDGQPGFSRRFAIRGSVGSVEIDVPKSFRAEPDVAKASAFTEKRERSRVAVVLIR